VRRPAPQKNYFFHTVQDLLTMCVAAALEGRFMLAELRARGFTKLWVAGTQPRRHGGQRGGKPEGSDLEWITGFHSTTLAHHMDRFRTLIEKPPKGSKTLPKIPY